MRFVYAMLPINWTVKIGCSRDKACLYWQDLPVGASQYAMDALNDNSPAGSLTLDHVRNKIRIRRYGDLCFESGCRGASVR